MLIYLSFILLNERERSGFNIHKFEIERVQFSRMLLFNLGNFGPEDFSSFMIIRNRQRNKQAKFKQTRLTRPSSILIVNIFPL